LFAQLLGSSDDSLPTLAGLNGPEKADVERARIVRRSRRSRLIASDDARVGDLEGCFRQEVHRGAILGAATAHCDEAKSGPSHPPTARNSEQAARKAPDARVAEIAD